MIPTPQKLTAQPMAAKPNQYQQATDSAFDQAKRSLDPQWEQSRKRFDQTMINKGLSPDSEAYKTEFDNFSRSKNDAYDNARFNSMRFGEDTRRWDKGFDLNEFSTYDNINRAYNDQSYRDAVFNASREDTKYNQLAGLMGGIPVQGASPLDVSGAYGQQYQGQLASWKNQEDNKQANAQGWRDMAGSIGTAMIMSSKDVKDHKKPTDHSKLAKAMMDLPVEEWQYKGDNEKHVGTYAEDFNEAIGKGPMPMINQMDYNGAMLAAMKDFDRRLKNKGAA